jgi:hypothetical protein
MAFILLGLGIGLLTTILVLGDRIKDLKKDIREQEQALLKKLKINWKTLRPLLRSKGNPDEKLTSVGLLLAGRKLDVALLKMFEKAEKQSEKLRICHLMNYYFLILLTVVLILGAPFDFLFSDEHKFSLFCLSLSKEVVAVIVIVIISLYIIIRLILTRIREDKFRNLLDQIGDKI